MAIETTAAPTASRTAGVDDPTAAKLSVRARLVLFLLCAAQFAVALDFSILNIALPTLGRDLHMTQANLQWGMTAFALPSGGFLLLFGRIADTVGRRKIFIAGLSLFTASSVLATLAWSPAAFLAGRALQGVGAAAIVPAGMALLTTTFKEGRERDRALGIMGSLMALGFTFGMVLGGVLTETLTWRSTMALNVVMGLLVLVGAPLLLTESRNEVRQRIDVPGAITVTGGLLALIYGLSTAAQSGFGDASVIGALVAAVLLLGGFIVIESRTEQPLVSLRILRRPSVAFGNLGGLTTFSMMTAVVFLGTLYLQQVNGLSPVSTGLIFGVMGIVCAITGNVAPRVVARIGSVRTLVGGLLLQGALTAVLLTISHGSGGTWVFTVAASLAAVGHLSAIVAYSVTATSGLPNDEQGLATGLVTTTQQVGMTVGIPLLSAVASARSDALRSAGHTVADATLGGVRVGVGVDAVLIVALAVVVGFGLRKRPGQ
ncbi:MFS transporter [Streptacidiphilus carbonis]|uniref:MFS transporter n=1 Tax=Streptacidiphilus carbonis TaxID=105422 RepID=UPI0005A81BD9|nr:MFS transporter [Streptacidiphilus carbonis]